MNREAAAVLAAPERVAAAHKSRAAALAPHAAEALQRLTDLAARLLGTSYAWLSVLDDEVENIVASVRAPAEYGERPVVPAAGSLCVYVVAAELPFVVRDTVVEARLEGNLHVAALGLRSYLGVPVFGDGGLPVGALCVADRQPRVWPDGEVRLLEDLAAAAASELRLRVALRDLHAGKAVEAALHHVAVSVARGDAPDDVLTAVAAGAAETLAAPGAVVLRFLSSGRAEPTAQHGEPAEGALDAAAPALATLRDRAEPVVDDGAGVVAVPVRVDARLWGAVVVFLAPRGERNGMPADVFSQLTRLADLAALGISNADVRSQLLEAARTDPLTGAENRRAFTERLTEELRRSERHGTPLTLALLDLDHLKQINDESGHDVGDRVMRELIGRITPQLRGGDHFARIGGDEFALVLPDTDYLAAAAVIDRIRSGVEEAPLAGVVTTVTIGAAVHALGSTSEGELYRAADQALYRAKEAGRNAVALELLE